MFMDSIQTTPSATPNPRVPQPVNSKIEREVSFPSGIEVIDIPRGVPPSSSSLLCVHSNFVTRFDSVPSGERWEVFIALWIWRSFSDASFSISLGTSVFLVSILLVETRFSFIFDSVR